MLLQYSTMMRSCNWKQFITITITIIITTTTTTTSTTTTTTTTTIITSTTTNSTTNSTTTTLLIKSNQSKNTSDFDKKSSPESIKLIMNSKEHHVNKLVMKFVSSCMKIRDSLLVM